MGLYRSEFMRLYQLTVPKDDAWEIMNDFGENSLSHFIDLNKDEQPYTLPYTPQVKACEESERKLQYLLDQCKKNNIKVTPPKSTEEFMNQLRRYKDNKKKAYNLLLDDMQKDIAQQESFIQDQNLQLKEAENSLSNLMDCQSVLKVASNMIPQLTGQFKQDKGDGNTGSINQTDMENRGLIIEQHNENHSKSINIQHVAGVVDQADIQRLKKLIFRSTKGKSFVHIQEIFDQEHQMHRQRSVYIIVFWDGVHIRDRIQRICDTFSGQRFDLPAFSDIQ